MQKKIWEKVVSNIILSVSEEKAFLSRPNVDKYVFKWVFFILAIQIIHLLQRLQNLSWLLDNRMFQKSKWWKISRDDDFETGEDWWNILSCDTLLVMSF